MSPTWPTKKDVNRPSFQRYQAQSTKLSSTSIAAATATLGAMTYAVWHTSRSMAVQGTVTRSSSSTLDGSLACDAGAESHTLDGERVTALAATTATAEGNLKAAAVLDPRWGRPVSADNVPAFMLAQTGLDNEQKLPVALCRRQAWLRAFQLGPTLALWTYAGCVMIEASKLIKLPKGTRQGASLAAAVGGMTLGAYLGAAMGPTLVANGVPAPAVSTVVTNWVTSLAQVPGGLLNFDNPNYDKNYLVFTYQNATGQIDVRGIDIAVDYLFNDVYSISATYSNLNRNVWTNAPGATAANPLTANAAKNRGTVTLRYDNQARGMTGELRTRYTGGFPVNSGVYNSYNQSTPIRYEAVPSNLFIDAGFSVSVPWLQNTRWAVNAQNLLDNRVNSFIGVPEVGRMVTTRLSYTF